VVVAVVVLAHTEAAEGEAVEDHTAARDISINLTKIYVTTPFRFLDLHRMFFGLI